MHGAGAPQVVPRIGDRDLITLLKNRKTRNRVGKMIKIEHGVVKIGKIIGTNNLGKIEDGKAGKNLRNPNLNHHTYLTESVQDETYLDLRTLSIKNSFAKTKMVTTT